MVPKCPEKETKQERQETAKQGARERETLSTENKQNPGVACTLGREAGGLKPAWATWATVSKQTNKPRQAKN